MVWIIVLPHGVLQTLTLWAVTNSGVEKFSEPVSMLEYIGSHNT